MSIAEYFLYKDPERIVFTKNLVEKNGRKFYEGNARLNKYLHLSQNVYIAKTRQKLFEDDLYAYTNGAVALNVLDNYSILWGRNNLPEITPEIANFLDKIYMILQNASTDELIDISHEDSEWINKCHGYTKESQRMDSLSHALEYQSQYEDIVELMEHINI